MNILVHQLVNPRKHVPDVGGKNLVRDNVQPHMAPSMKLNSQAKCDTSTIQHATVRKCSTDPAHPILFTPPRKRGETDVEGPILREAGEYFQISHWGWLFLSLSLYCREGGDRGGQVSFRSGPLVWGFQDPAVPELSHTDAPL